MTNALAHETSPYLLQHKDNPVDWQPWGPAALAAAKGADKPILLSVGYAACHWCHVMAHECFEDAAIARLQNELFVNIKVDREERPDIDAIYQHALALLGEQGGWPLTMFLTPAGEPYWGGTYFPPTSRYGRPGFPDVLRAMADAYKNQREKVASNVKALGEALQKLAQPKSGQGISIAITDQIARRLVREVDPFHGGIGDAPKFPQVGAFDLMWRGWKRTRQEPMKHAVLLTLDHIAQGGIYDHVGGGFSRYSVDTEWLVPHFEKMLYDNALLVELMTAVWQETRSGLLSLRVCETIEWLEREMLGPGAFFSSLDADSEHEEGKFYVWTEAEIDALLGSRAARFKPFYDVTPAGNWEGKTILNRLKRLALADQPTEAELAACRAVLFRAREERVRPGLDDKVLADWNGLAICALAKAGVAFGRPDWIDFAADALDFCATQMTGADGRLRHAWREGKQGPPAILDDYANLARAALALYEATGEARYLDRATAWVALVDRHHWDAAAGGYFFTADDAEALITRSKSAVDQPNPSGNGTMVEVLARLHYLTGEARYRERAEATVAAFAGEIERNFLAYAALLNGNELLLRALQIVVVGRRGADDTEALLRAVHGVSLPTKVLQVIESDAALPAGHPARGKGQVEGRATAYVCEGPVCSLPLTDPAALAADLAQRR